MPTEAEQRILNYLSEHSTMILSTWGSDGPWATPVFYVNLGFKLYFLSEPTTRHSLNLQQSPVAAAAVTEDHHDWRTIQGLQLQGRAGLAGFRESARALAAYCQKFPDVKQILQKPGAFKGVAKARWHCLVPEALKFTDNSRVFGERFELRLSPNEAELNGSGPD